MTRIKRPKNRKWEKVTAEELFDLSFRKNKIDSEIAEMYSVTPEQVSYKRNKFDLKHVYGSLAQRWAMIEHGIDAVTSACNIDEEYRQKYMDLTTKYFRKLIKNK